MRNLFIWALPICLLVAGVSSASGQQTETANPPSSAAPAPNPNPPEGGAFVNGALTVPGADADSQTVPAKFSRKNDRLDSFAIMALPLALSETQKKRIAETVLQANAPIEMISAKPSEVLPERIAPQVLPQGLATEIPAVGNLSYVRIPKKVLLVSAPNMIVVDEITIE